MIKKHIILGALFIALALGQFNLAFAADAKPSFLAGLWGNLKGRVRPLFNVFYFPTDPQPPVSRLLIPKSSFGKSPSSGSLYGSGKFGFGGPSGFSGGLPGGSGDFLGGLGGGFRGGGFLESLPRGGVSDLERSGDGKIGFLESLPSGGDSGLEHEIEKSKVAPPPPPPRPASTVPPKLAPTTTALPTSKTAQPTPSLAPPTVGTPQTKAIHLGIGSRNNSLAYVKEGDIAQFTAMLGFADRTSKEVTNDVKWAVLGDVGSITSAGVFTAKLGPAVSEYGRGAGSVTATYSGPDGILLGKSSIFTVYAFVEAEGDIGGQ